MEAGIWGKVMNILIDGMFKTGSFLWAHVACFQPVICTADHR
jgi:hypothetical protein